MMQQNKYEYIEQELEKLICSGEYTDKLPSEKELARLFNTTPVTASKALNCLRDRNVIVRVAGKGSFVNKNFSSGIRLMMPTLPDSITAEIKKELIRYFPQFNFEFIKKCQPKEGLADMADIFHYTSYFPGNYEEYFSPFPSGFQHQLTDQEYYSDAFKIHTSSNRLYGLPFMISPILFICNKELYRKYVKEIGISDLTLENLYKIEANLPKKVKLFDMSRLRKSGLLYCIFNFLDLSSHKRCNASTLSWKTIDQALSQYRNIYEKSIGTKSEFADGNILFSFCDRQYFTREVHKNWDFSWDVIPGIPACNYLNLVGSESLFISNKIEKTEPFIEICRFFLSPTIQNIFAEHRYGIPVLRSSSTRNIGNTEYRDDLFFSELKNTVFSYQLMSKPFMNSLITNLEKFNLGEKTFEEFRIQAKQLYEFDQQSKEGQKLIFPTYEAI